MEQKNWVEIADDRNGLNVADKETEFKLTTLESSSCDYSDS